MGWERQRKKMAKKCGDHKEFTNGDDPREKVGVDGKGNTFWPMNE